MNLMLQTVFSYWKPFQCSVVHGSSISSHGIIETCIGSDYVASVLIMNSSTPALFTLPTIATHIEILLSALCHEAIHITRICSTNILELCYPPRRGNRITAVSFPVFDTIGIYLLSKYSIFVVLFLKRYRRNKVIGKHVTLVFFILYIFINIKVFL